MTTQTQTMADALDGLLAGNSIVPVVVLHDAAHAVPVGEALKAGGIGTAEVTFRTAAAAEAIQQMQAVEGMTVGAGTIVNAQQAEQAIAAGAAYLVSPGFSAEVASVAIDAGIPYLPGAVTGTEIIACLDRGFTTVKFFPAVTSGGLPAVKALTGPFPGLRFIPTGGIGVSNLAEWISKPFIAAVGGSWMVPADAVSSGNWGQITTLSRQAIGIVEEALV